MRKRTFVVILLKMFILYFITNKYEMFLDKLSASKAKRK